MRAANTLLITLVSMTALATMMFGLASLPITKTSCSLLCSVQTLQTALSAPSR